MPDIVDSSRFIGFLGPAGNSGQLSTAMRDAGAEVVTLPRPGGLIATWAGAKLNVDVTADGIAILSAGHLEPLGHAAVERFRRGDMSIVDGVRGEFALAIVDGPAQKAFLAVDRVGIATVYYGRADDGTLVFASDLSLIRRFAAMDFTVDPQAIYGYTYYHAVPSPLTIYAGISKIPPGHRFVHEAGADSLERYWHPQFSASTDRSEADLESELFDILRSSVRRCATDSSIGGFLSGGLDSSTVCGILREATGRKVPAVSVGFDEEGYDEIVFAKAAVDHFDLEHIVHYMTPNEIADSIATIVNGYSEPFGNSSVVPSYICALTAAQNGITTLLAGDGGDELFAGNTRYAKQKLFDYYFRIPRLLRTGATDPLFGGPERAWHVGPLRKIHRYITQANVRLPDRLQSFNLLEMRPADDVFCPDFLGAVDTGHPLGLLRDEYQALDTSPVNRMLFSDWRFTLADNDLRKVTRTCELAGVDVRFPLLDDDVIDFSTRVPARLKLKGLKLRHFYRQALRNYLPDAVVNKSKHGFGLPFGEWLRSSDRLQDMVNDALASLRERGIYEDAFVDSLLDAHRSQHAAFFGNMVWVLAMLEWWLAAHEPGFSLSS